MRLSKDGGRSYRTSNERSLTKALPSLPAAVRIVGTDGRVAALCLDLDSSRGGVEAVESDYQKLGNLLERHGLRWIGDISPSGGRHIYIPWKNRIAFTDARETVEALARRFPTIDPGPHQNAEAGCIRTPGSPYKRGGFQRLLTPLNRAYDIAKRPNSAGSWKTLRRELRYELATVAQRRGGDLVLLDTTDSLPAPLGSRGAIPQAKQEIARTGRYDAARYSSPSEARQAVLASAAAAGWALTDVLGLMRQNLWAGMVGFYARYGTAGARSAALRRDWNKAVRYVQTKRKENALPTIRNPNDRKSYTSEPNTQGGLGRRELDALSPFQYVRTWRSALELYEGRLIGTRFGLIARLVLRAIGEAAAKTGSRFVEFGVRSVALASGVHHTTTARHLRELSQGGDGMIRLVKEAQGTRGDVYELVIPVDLLEAARRRPWRKGKIHALRPVFRELGVVAAFVYEAIETNDGELSSAEVARRAQLSPSSVNIALESLAAWLMIERSGGRWRVIRTTNLLALADRFGVLDAVSVQIGKYRQERAEWHQWLELRNAFGTPPVSPGNDYPYWIFAPPEEDSSLAWVLTGTC